MKDNAQHVIENNKKNTFKVGEWTVQPERSCMMSANGDIVEIEMMAVELLKYLALHQNKVISVDILMDNVWAGKIVTQGTIRRIVSILRKALNDDTKHPTYIQNIPKRGYVLIAPVSFDIADIDTKVAISNTSEKNSVQVKQEPPVGDPASLSSKHSSTNNEVSTQAQPHILEDKRRKKPQPIWIVSSIIVVCGIALLVFSQFFASNNPQHANATQAVSLKGSELHPELDPTNGRLLFSHFSPENEYWQIYSSDLTTSALRQLTSGKTINMFPKLTSDGKKLAYVSYNQGKFQLITADYDNKLTNQTVNFESQTSISSIEWVNDNTELFVAARDERNIYSIYSLDITDSEVSRITHPPGGSKGDYLSAVSKDKKYLAVARLTSSISEIIVFDLNNMAPLKVIKASSIVPSIAWHNSQLVYLDGKTIAAADADKGWSISYIYQHDASLSGISVSENELFMTVGDLSNSEIRQLDNPFSQSPQGQNNLKISSNFPDYFGEYSHVNDNVYFVSQRNGLTQVWMQNDTSGLSVISEFSDTVQVNHLATAYHEDIIAGVADEKLFILDPSKPSSAPAFPSTINQRVSHPNWSFDGKYLYFILHTIDDKELWRLKVEDGTTQKVMKNVQRVLTSSQQPDLLVQRNDHVMYLAPDTLVLSDPILTIELDHNEDWQRIENNLYWSTVSIEGAKLSVFDLETGLRQQSDVIQTGDTGRFSINQDQSSILMTFFLPDQTDIYKIPLNN